MLAYYSKNCKGGSIVIDVPAFVMSCSLVRPGALLSTRRIPAAPPHSQKTPVSPGAGHGQGPLPRDREDSIGMPFARFQRTLAVLPQDFRARGYTLFRCFRPVFSTRGSGRGSMSITLTVHHKRPFYFHNTRSSSQSQLPKMLQRLFASHAHPHQNAGYEPDILFPACH